MGKVATIHVNPPDPDVVALFERWLARARAGEIRAVACLVLLSDGAYGGAYPGEWRSHLETLGALAHMQAALDAMLSEGSRLVEF